MAFITIAGQNQIAKKQGDKETLNIAMFVLANVPDLDWTSEPATRIESIPNEYVVDQLAVTKSGYVNTNQVVYSLVMGSNIGDYDFNWLGLVDDEGELIAVTYIPLTSKIKNNGGVPGNTFTRNFLVSYVGIQQTSSITVPAETWQIDFTARLSGVDERERLANFDIYGHEGFLGDGWKITGSEGVYSVATGVGYVGGIRIKSTAVQELTTTTFPNEIWLNVSLQGDISDMTAVGEFVIDTGPFADYIDGNGVAHYLTKLAEIDAAGDVVDVRKLAYLKDVKSHQTKTLFTVSGDENDIILTSPSGITPIAALNDFDEFSFIVSATNTSSTMTIKIDELDAVSLSGISSDTQIFETALLTVRYINGAFYIAEQINPKTGNPVSLIGEILSTSFAQTGACKMRFNAGELNRSTHPILFAKAQKTGLVDQALKDADLREYGGKWGDGDGSTTFTCPIYDGAFTRYADNGRGLDVGRELNTWQADENKSHDHGLSSYVNLGGQSGWYLYSGTGGVGVSEVEGMVRESGGIDARPMNYAVNGEFLV